MTTARLEDDSVIAISINDHNAEPYPDNLPFRENEHMQT